MTVAALAVCIGCSGLSGWAHAARSAPACNAQKTAKGGKKAKSGTAKASPTPAQTDKAKATTPVATQSRSASHTLPARLPAPPPLPAKYRAVALLPFVGVEVGEEITRSVERALLAEIDELAPMQSISPQDVRADLHTYNLDLAQCEGDAECLAQMARYVRAHAAIDVQLAFVGGTVSLSLRLLDTQTGTQTAAVADTVSDDAGTRAVEVHRLAVQLLAPDSYVGSLTVVVPEAGTDVYLDDKLVGTAPIPAPFEKLRAGPHILRLSKPGFSDLYQFVDVSYNRNTTVTADLRSNTISGAIVEAVAKAGLGSIFVASQTAGIEIRIDGEPHGTTMLTAPIASVPAGHRRISLRLGGQAAVREVNVEANRRTDILVTMTATGPEVGGITVVGASTPLPSMIAAPPQPPSPEVALAYSHRAKMIRAFAWTSLALGAGGCIATGVVHAIASSHASDLRAGIEAYNKSTTHDAAGFPSLTAQQKSINTLNVGVVVAAALGGVGIATGAALWLFGPSPSAYDVTLSAGAGPHAGLWMGGTFAW